MIILQQLGRWVKWAFNLIYSLVILTLVLTGCQSKAPSQSTTSSKPTRRAAKPAMNSQTDGAGVISLLPNSPGTTLPDLSHLTLPPDCVGKATSFYDSSGLVGAELTVVNTNSLGGFSFPRHLRDDGENSIRYFALPNATPRGDSTQPVAEPAPVDSSVRAATIQATGHFASAFVIAIATIAAAFLRRSPKPVSV